MNNLVKVPWKIYIGVGVFVGASLLTVASYKRAKKTMSTTKNLVSQNSEFLFKLKVKLNLTLKHKSE